MRLEHEVDDFESQLSSKDEDRELKLAMFEACVPRDFWSVKPDDIKFNRAAFDEAVLPYCGRIVKARARGYGLLFFGDNGVGKTIMMSFVLGAAIRAGFTVYYTTLPRLDHDIKRGFDDRTVAERLRWMMTSDFMAIDELGKEQFRAGGGDWIRSQVERILKERFDDSLPTLVASNASRDTIESIYGASVASILDGKFLTVSLEPGDYRREIRKRMSAEMGL